MNISRWLAVMVLFVGGAQADERRLQGDPAAVARVETMIERLGGATVWQRTRTLHLVYHGWRTGPDEPVVEHAWRDLTMPSERVEFEGRSFKVIRAFDEQGGWMSRNGELRPMNEEQLARSVDFWPGDFYTMIRRFAVADQDLRLSWVEPRRVEVRSAAGADLGWWEIDSFGQPVRWGWLDEGEPLEYVYQPVKAFGNINFPSGGAATDGFWRFTYDIVDVSDGPVPESPENP